MSDTGHMRWNDHEKLADHGDSSENTMDRRALRTRSALHHALIRLILERDYDEISVSDITEAADVGRSTFYTHFTDKDDLLRKGTGRLRGLLFEQHETAAAGEVHPALRILGFSRFMTVHLKEQHQLYRALMRGRAGPIIIGKIREFLSDLVRKELASIEDAAGQIAPAPEVAVQFVVGGYMSILTWWLDRGAREPAEEIERWFRDLALGGLNTLLRR